MSFLPLRIKLILFILLIGTSSAFAQKKLPFLTPGAKYLWPTTASHDMSSSFAETRPNHFHAGLDIKTWGRRGYPVVATRSGILWRLRTDPVGYGRVVYLQHKDGSYSVYAHLEHFAPRIQHLADSLRMINYQYNFDQYVSKYHIHIKQGQVIGYTGSSGAGPPHLHFELRTPEKHPFNPFLTNLKVEDHIAPIFQELSVEPLHSNSLAEGRKRIYLRRVRRLGKRSYTFGTIRVRGSIGLGVEVYDKSDHVDNVYAPYQLILKRGNTVYFHSRVDSFSYKNTAQLNLDRVYPILRKSKRGFQRLYVHDGNTLTYYIQTKNRGRLNLPPGTYNFTILASDYWGNTSKATLRLIVMKPEPAPKPVIKHISAMATPVSLKNDNPIPPGIIERWHWTENWFAPSSNIHTLDMISTSSHPKEELIYHMKSHHSGIPVKYRKPVIIRLSNGDESYLHRIYPGKQEIIRTPDRRATAHFTTSSVYDTLSVIFNHGIYHHKPFLYLLPEEEPMHNDVTLSYKLGDKSKNEKGLAFYTYKKSKRKYEYLNSIKRGNRLKAKVDEFGFYYILQDTVKPSVSHPEIFKQHDGKWVASVRLTDNLSGIDYEQVQFYVNGVRGIAEYHPEARKLVYYRPHFLPERSDTLKIVASDRVGNTASKTFVIKH